MDAIVITDRRWAIGRDGGLLFSLPADMRRFRALTLDGTVIMGGRTLRSFPGGRPLPRRRNIVVTRDPARLPEGAEPAPSPEEALALAGGPEAEGLWLIGGGSVYAALLDRCRRVWLTRVDALAEAPDTFFPDLDALPGWEVASAGEWMEEGGLRFRFLQYVNAEPHDRFEEVKV
ncbi:dihydrofolate reductase [uncultured Oscillibacter sp.]|uniref:dihydrofolate reductase n=1 Tax=uncultured Oscillibacter sp. TaxID=876091 RepID=UPI0025D96D57|nr:dihydrofolate reductase [uncultured Oscillibacter sp.]